MQRYNFLKSDLGWVKNNSIFFDYVLNCFLPCLKQLFKTFCFLLTSLISGMGKKQN